MSIDSCILIATAVIAAVSVPLILGIIPRNRLYGFRTPSTLASDEVWFRANHFAGWAFFFAAVVSAIIIAGIPDGAGFGPGFGPTVLGSSVLVALAASFLHLRAIRKR